LINSCISTGDESDRSSIKASMDYNYKPLEHNFHYSDDENDDDDEIDHSTTDTSDD